MRLGLANIVLSEEELAVQIRHLDIIVVRDSDFTFRRAADTHEGEGLDQLATEGTCTDHKCLDFCQLLLNFTAKDTNLVIVAAAHRLTIHFLLRQGLEDVVMHPLLEWGVLACLLDNLLGNDAAEESTQGRDGA